MRSAPSQHGRLQPTRTAAYAFTAISTAALIGMLGLFAFESLPVWRQAGASYVSASEWFYRSERFGSAAMIYGTLVVAAIATGLAAPIGIGAAIGTSELLSGRTRVAVKVVVELLAGVPSVVYGLLGILFLRGWVDNGLRALGLDSYGGDSLLSAGLLLALMVLPTIVTLADDALRAVPGQQRRAARGLGLTRGESIVFVALPQASRGLIAAVLLGLGRALGETIAVFLVVGRRDNQWPAPWFSLEPLAAPGQTLSSKLGGSETSIAWGDPLHWAAIVGLGLVLFVLVLGVTLLGALLRPKEARRA